MTPDLLACVDSLQFLIPYYVGQVPVDGQVLAFVAFVAMAVFAIVVGALASVRSRHITNTGHLFEINTDIINIGHSLALPIVAGVMLVVLYQSIGGRLIDFLHWYTLIGGTVASYFVIEYLLGAADIWGLFRRYRLTLSSTDIPTGHLERIDYAANSFDEKNFKRYLRKHNFIVYEPKEVAPHHQTFNYVFDTRFLVAAPLVAALMYCFYKCNQTFNPEYRWESNWVVANAVAVNFAIFGISSMRLNSYKTGLLLLIGLFCYDIYFVYGTTIMTEVATSVSLPIKLVMPHFVKHEWGQGDSLQYSMLGLGDIIVPGYFMSLLHRVDRRTGTKYFLVSVVAYVVGLGITFIALLKYRQGQPALLNIVPCLAIGCLGYSFAINDVRNLLKYNEEIENYDHDVQYPSDDEVEDEDPNYELDSYDEWEFKVEDMRDVDTEVDEEDLNEALYEFGEDDDDQTFIIEASDVDSDNSDPESAHETESETGEELEILLKDNKRQVTYWYKDD